MLKQTKSKFKDYDTKPVHITDSDESTESIVYQLFFHELSPSFTYEDRLEYVVLRTGLRLPQIQKIAIKHNYRAAFTEGGTLLANFEDAIKRHFEASKDTLKALGYTTFEESEAPTAQAMVTNLRKYVGGSIDINAKMLQHFYIMWQGLTEIQYKLLLKAGGFEPLYNDPRNVALKLQWDKLDDTINKLSDRIKGLSSSSTLPAFAKVLGIEDAADAFGEDVDKGALTVEEINRIVTESSRGVKLLGESNELHSVISDILNDNDVPVLDAKQTSIATQKATKNIKHEGLE